jgi:hypothetical protein
MVGADQLIDGSPPDKGEVSITAESVGKVICVRVISCLGVNLCLDLVGRDFVSAFVILG